MSGEWDAGMTWVPFVQDCMRAAGWAGADTAAGKVFVELADGPLYEIARAIAYVEACDSGIDGLGIRLAPHIDEAIAMLEKLRQAPDVKGNDEATEQREDW